MSLYIKKTKKEKKYFSIEKTLFMTSSAIIFLGIIFTIIFNIFNLEINLSPIPCILNSKFHLYCPGCGGTRALNSLLTLSLLDSFLYHPIVLYSVCIFIYYYIKTAISLLRKKEYSKFHFNYLILYIGLAIIIINFILKNILAISLNIDYLGDISLFWQSMK
ncbi:MAG: DUF2752 domain-containing protein [Clostridium butyricum]|nr:DUF2752 domain-containing protein [Clostridium butyricum]